MGGPGSGRKKGSGNKKNKGLSKTDKKQIRSNKKLDKQYRKDLRKQGIDPATGNKIR
jgi:hypothetical protein